MLDVHQRERSPFMNDAEVADTKAGFALSRVLSGTPSEVFAHFTEPALFSRWLIVEGFATPASRVRLDPGPGDQRGDCARRGWP
jgi:uncharacterized protein YndB with AHSA1/START domain